MAGIKHYYVLWEIHLDMDMNKDMNYQGAKTRSCIYPPHRTHWKQVQPNERSNHQMQAYAGISYNITVAGNTD
jgi:hypothetical protein